ncbi:hypothetical protein LIER_20607 [Lithospermum erythrorhizon]|uniref:Reverse transcriptase Ty1/copia-type domain-containing protein n=1 Tax=Lithospermum erythrorhizon TaxID=34254 RepID=A0AAV3QQ27_LITER
MSASVLRSVSLALWHHRLGHSHDGTFRKLAHQFNWSPGGEFRSCNKYFQDIVIRHRHRVSCPHTHEQMGRVECRHRHIVDMGLSPLAHSGLDLSFWQFTFETSVFLINRLPTPVNQNISPFELLLKSVPDYMFLRSFGVFVIRTCNPVTKHKCSFRFVKCVFMSYSPMHNGYWCLDVLSKSGVSCCTSFRYCSKLKPPISSTSSAPSLAICPSRAFQTTAPYPSSPTPNRVNHQRSPPPPISSVSPSPPTTSSPGRPPSPLDRTNLQSKVNHMSLRPNPKPSHKKLASHPHAFTVSAVETEPTCFTQANTCPLWRQAMGEEINAMLRTNTWSLVPPDPTMIVVGCRWVFSPVIKTPTIRSIISIIVSFNWHIRQIDIQNAFLHGTLNETVYVVQPSGFVDERIQLIMLVYVDHILVSGNHSSSVADFIAALSSKFVTRDLGTLSFFLGIEALKQADGSLLLSQLLRLKAFSSV